MKRDRKKRRDRKGEGELTPQSQRRDVRGRTKQLDPAAESRPCHSCQRPTVPLETQLFSFPPSPSFHYTLTLLHRILEAAKRRLPHLQQTECNEMSCPVGELHKPIFPSPPDVGRKPPPAGVLSLNFGFAVNNLRGCITACTDLLRSAWSHVNTARFTSALAKQTAANKEASWHVLQNMKFELWV